jgi:SAM-dependent methyltransferase
MRQPLAFYDDALRHGHPLTVRHSDGVERVHDVTGWVADADAVDRRLLRRCAGPTVDLGCGPGRLAAALAGRGVPALGVDLSPRAVAMARARGAAAIVRDLFAPLPGDGRWDAALLIDGNIGIGGRPDRLLHRVARLLRPGGALLVEVRPEDVDRRGIARLVGASGQVSGAFGWAELGAAALRGLAAGAGWSVREEWSDGGRRFTRLQRPSGTPS